ncbi:MAG: rRNA maturation RNase YbeY [Syntrophales bacterium]|nr:rRNA maturation RNase YbeY [Syntrophales bacterium]
MIINIEDRQKKVKLSRKALRQTIRQTLRLLGREKKELSVVFMDNEGIQEINRDYLKRDRPTNVISFAMTEGPFGSINPDILGDIVISVERAAEDAMTGDIPFQDELDFLLIHGILHLVGYNHEGVSENEAAAMAQKEQEIFLALKGYHLTLD